MMDLMKKLKFVKFTAAKFHVFSRLFFWVFASSLLIGFEASALAQENVIDNITASQQSNGVVVKIVFSDPVLTHPVGFSMANPARVVLDFSETKNGTSNTSQDIGLGEVRNLNVVQAGGRARLVFNLKRTLNYSVETEGNTVSLVFSESSVAADLGLPSPVPVLVTQAKTSQEIRDIDFRRGTDGEGRVVIDLPNNQVGVDVRQQGQSIVVDLLQIGLPGVLNRRLDVVDFGTPVRLVTAVARGENVQVVIDGTGLWEHSAYQSDNQLVILLKPIKEDLNKLTQGTQGYRGDKLSLNFQNVEVRAVLQVIADFTGLNVITSDTVNGTLTLRLKDVPWDQALDIVMQAKGLDLRKNGSVLWIAPKDELLTKEKLELEQKALIAELEPLKSEVFQLNYQKAEAFKQVFGLDGADSKNRLLSKRGSAVIDPRTNQLFITDISTKLEEVRKLIQKTDIATRQVLIEARIVEADDKFSKNLGAKLGFADLRTIRGGSSGYNVSGNTRIAATGTYTGVGEQTGQIDATSSSFTPNSQFVNLPAAGINGLNPGNLAVSLFSAAANRFLTLELSALEADGKGKIISSPRVVTADQQQALIEQGTELPYQQATSSGATSVSFRKANLRLEVTPQITPDGNIILVVDVNKDTVGQETRSGFAIDTKHVKTQVQVENGGTVVLGGIFQQTERTSVTKVPVFGDIPLFGNLFKTTGSTNDKTELLIFLTPKVMTERTPAQ